MLNSFGTGLLVDAIGDPDLAWQKTLDFNVGLDVSIINRIHLNVDFYHKSTDPLLASIGTPSSVGVSNRLANIGKQVTDGFNGTLRYLQAKEKNQLDYKPYVWPRKVQI